MAVATTQEGMIFVAGEFRAPSGGATTESSRRPPDAC